MTLIAGSWPTEPYSPISFQPTILLLHQFVAFATTGTSSPDPEAFGEWAIFAKRTLPLFQSKMGAVLIDDWDVSKFYTNKICVDIHSPSVHHVDFLSPAPPCCIHLDSGAVVRFFVVIGTAVSRIASWVTMLQRHETIPLLRPQTARPVNSLLLPLTRCLLRPQIARQAKSLQRLSPEVLLRIANGHDFRRRFAHRPPSKLLKKRRRTGDLTADQ